jgi:hypothetical protein
MATFKATAGYGGQCDFVIEADSADDAYNQVAGFLQGATSSSRLPDETDAELIKRLRHQLAAFAGFQPTQVVVRDSAGNERESDLLRNPLHLPGNIPVQLPRV